MASNPGISALLDIYGKLLSQKQFEIIDSYYNNDLSLSEIAENEGMTKQGVSDSIKRGEQFMLETESKLKINRNIYKLRRFAETLDKDKMLELTKLIEEMY